MSIASVERRHATHRQAANPGMPFYMFSADSVLAEARQQLTAVVRTQDERMLASHVQLVSSGSPSRPVDFHKLQRLVRGSIEADLGGRL